MKNKNLIYVALGLGAGIFAYYYFCRRKYVANGQGEQEIGGDGKPNVSPSNPTGREYAPPPTSIIRNITDAILPTSKPITTTATNTTSTPVTTPVSVSTQISKPAETILSTSSTTSATTPVTSSVDKPSVSPIEKPALTIEPISKEISIAPTRTDVTTLKTAEPMKSGFDGIGQLCFEVGECLNDL